MALIRAKTVADERPITYDNEIAAKIQRRRYQIMVHSLLYYDLDINLISDATWAQWAKELVELQNNYSDIASKVIFAECFKSFDASTGFNLPYRDEQIVRIAYRLLLRQKSAESEDAIHKLKYGVRTIQSEYDKYKKKSHSTKPVTIKKEEKQVEQKPRKGLFSVTRT